MSYLHKQTMNRETNDWSCSTYMTSVSNKQKVKKRHLTYPKTPKWKIKLEHRRILYTLKAGDHKRVRGEVLGVDTVWVQWTCNINKPKLLSGTVSCTEEKWVGGVSKLRKTGKLALKEKKGPVNEGGRTQDPVNLTKEAAVVLNTKNKREKEWMSPGPRKWN